MNGIACAFKGRVGKNAERRRVKNGELLMVSFSVAVEGKVESEVTWVRVVMFGEEAEALAYRLTKGTQLYIEGRLSLNAWVDKQGVQHTGLNIVAWVVQPLGQIGKRRPNKPRAQKPAGAWKPNLTPVPAIHDFDDPLNF